jgi:hypothetical protein
MGVVLPDRGHAIVEGVCTDTESAMRAIAERLVTARNPVFFPGPLILWDWKEGVAEKATALRELADAVGAKIIPMPDYRPKYPMINPEVEVNPNHPNLTIWHNRIDVCLFIGVHCHYANIALKIIRGGSDCFTIALCAEAGHEDAMISLRDSGIAELATLKELVLALKETTAAGTGVGR